MNSSFWGVGMVLLGLAGLAFVLLFQNISATDNQNYYLLKEVTEASMIDAVDIAKFRETGEVRIYEEKFVESFIQRWSESADRGREYVVEIYDVVESPPKVSLKVTSLNEEFMMDVSGKPKADGTVSTKEDMQFDIVGQLDAILETKY